MAKQQVVRAVVARKRLVAWVVVVVGIATGACHDDDRRGAIEHDDKHLNDAQIAQILLSVSSGEIQVADVAGPKAETPQVKAFAARMTKDHTAARQALEQTMMARSIGRDRSMQGDQVDSEATSLLDKINVRKGDDLEWEYMKGQVELHQDALDLIDGELLERVTDPELRMRLDDMKSLVQHHLKDAVKIRDALGGVARE